MGLLVVMTREQLQSHPPQTAQTEQIPAVGDSGAQIVRGGRGGAHDKGRDLVVRSRPLCVSFTPYASVRRGVMALADQAARRTRRLDEDDERRALVPTRRRPVERLLDDLRVVFLRAVVLRPVERFAVERLVLGLRAVLLRVAFLADVRFAVERFGAERLTVLRAPVLRAVVLRALDFLAVVRLAAGLRAVVLRAVLLRVAFLAVVRFEAGLRAVLFFAVERLAVDLRAPVLVPVLLRAVLRAGLLRAVFFLAVVLRPVVRFLLVRLAAGVRLVRFEVEEARRLVVAIVPDSCMIGGRRVLLPHPAARPETAAPDGGIGSYVVRPAQMQTALFRRRYRLLNAGG